MTKVSQNVINGITKTNLFLVECFSTNKELTISRISTQTRDIPSIFMVISGWECINHRQITREDEIFRMFDMGGSHNLGQCYINGGALGVSNNNTQRFCETLLITTRSVGYLFPTSSLINERSARSDSISKLCLRPVYHTMHQV